MCFVFAHTQCTLGNHPCMCVPESDPPRPPLFFRADRPWDDVRGAVARQPPVSLVCRHMHLHLSLHVSNART